VKDSKNIKGAAGKRVKLGARYIIKYIFEGLPGVSGWTYSPLKPLDIVFDITHECNLKCLTCFRWTSGSGERELKTAECLAVIDGLKKWLGTFGLTFSGGEPFLRDDMVDIMRYASERGVFVAVVTNGTLIDAAMAGRIVASGVDSLALSLNSLRPELHNFTRGSETNFDEVVSAIGHLKQRGPMALSLCTTVIRENIEELPALVEFTAENGLNGINFQPLMEASTIHVFDEEGKKKKLPKGKLFEKMEGGGGDARLVDGVIERLIGMKGKGYPVNNPVSHLRAIGTCLKDPGDPALLKMPCRVGTNNFFIDPFGDVRICQVMDPVGNLGLKGPGQVWNSPEARSQRRAIGGCMKACRVLNCNFKELDLASRVLRTVRPFKERGGADRGGAPVE
jgi:MoaA/NifB/PqqE/SkfB family radical SAM enzyme